MSRRIDIELTSDRGDGTWTWRAAGAKQPKGVVKADRLPDGATVGQNLRAEVETTLDGTEVLDVSGPKAKNRSAAESIELLPRGGDEPLVTQTLAGGRGGRDRGDRGDRGDRRGGDRGDRGPRGPGGPRGDRSGGDRGPRGSGGPRGDRPGGGDRNGPRDGDRSRGPRGDSDGTDVLDVSGPKAKNRSAAESIELLPRGGDEPLVTQTLAGGRGGRDRGDRGDRGDRRGGDRGDRGPRGPGGPRGDRSGGDRGPRGSGGPRSDRPGGGDRNGPRDGDRSRGPRGDSDGTRRDRPRRERPAAPPAKPKARRLKAGRAHRKAALATLSPEEQVLGDYVLAGGIPAVRAAVEKQNAQAQAEGGRKVSAAPLLAVAERLLPALHAAEWRDRAEAAVAHLDDLDLRDLRSVVVGAETAAKNDEALALSAQLREGLTARVDREQAEWLAELAETLKEGRVVRALRLSSRPPKAGAPLPADLATRLAEAASASLTSDTFPDRWATVLDALSFSPARLTVVPASKPTEPSEELLAVIRRMADRVPKVAEAFGIEPVAPARRGRGGRGCGGHGFSLVVTGASPVCAYPLTLFGDAQ